jgi:hypothetical protein
LFKITIFPTLGSLSLSKYSPTSKRTNTMTTTQNYNPIFRAFRELTTPEAFRWYCTQAKATATLAQTIAHRSFTTAQRLLSNSKPMAIAAIAEQEYAQAITPAVQDDGDAVAGLKNAESLSEAIALEQEHALSEATEPEESPVSNDWEEIAPATAPGPELDDGECDRIAIDELEQAISSTELQQASADEIANDGETEAEQAWVNSALLDDDDTERRYWAGDDAEVVESPVLSYQEEDEVEALAGDEA